MSGRASTRTERDRRHALTFDVEDWHELVRRRVSSDPAHGPSKNVAHDTRRVLELLEEHGIRATFFVVGSVARAFPGLVQEISTRGHEIGSHSSEHRLVFEMTSHEFREDVRGSRRLLQDLSGQRIAGFRAPAFSVGRLDHWCFDVLREEGFAFDSSVFPIRGARYGVPGAPTRPFQVRKAAGASAEGGNDLWEFPLATWSIGRIRVPVAGGTYFRLLPIAVLRRALADLAADGGPAVFYFHPYEFHRGALFLGGETAVNWRSLISPASVRLHVLHNIATGIVGLRLRALLTNNRFVPLGDILNREYAVPR